MKQKPELLSDYMQIDTRSKLVLIISVSILAVLVVTAFLAYIIIHSVERTPFSPLKFPKDYSGLEGVDPEERVLFEGFRTSFLPDEELMLCQFHSKSKREVPDENDTSDIMFLWDFPEEVTDSKRLKRKSNATLRNDNKLDDEDEKDDKYYEIEIDINKGEDEKDVDYYDKKSNNSMKTGKEDYEEEYEEDDGLEEQPDYNIPYDVITEDENSSNVSNDSFTSDTFLKDSSEEEFTVTTKLKQKGKMIPIIMYTEYIERGSRKDIKKTNDKKRYNVKGGNIKKYNETKLKGKNNNNKVKDEDGQNTLLCTEYNSGDYTKNDGTDYIENDGANYTENDGGDYIENDDGDYTENDGGDYMESDGAEYQEPYNMHIGEGVNNEILRGGDDGTIYYHNYDDDYNYNEVETDGHIDKSYELHQNNDNKGNKRKSSKKGFSTKNPRGSTKSVRKTISTFKSKLKENIATDSISKEDKYYKEEDKGKDYKDHVGNKNKIEGNSQKETKETKSKHEKYENNGVKKNGTDSLHGNNVGNDDDNHSKPNNKTSSIRKEDEDYVQDGGADYVERREKNKNVETKSNTPKIKGKNNKIKDEDGQNTLNYTKNNSEDYTEYDSADYIENDDANYTENDGLDYIENDGANYTENDGGYYIESDGADYQESYSMHIGKGVNNEIERESTKKGFSTKAPKGSIKIKQKTHPDFKYIKSSKKGVSTKDPKGSIKILQKTNPAFKCIKSTKKEPKGFIKIKQKTNPAFKYIKDKDYKEGDQGKDYEEKNGDNVEGSSENETKATTSIDEEDEDCEDEEEERGGGDKKKETDSTDGKDKEHVEGYFKQQNNKTNSINKRNADYVEKGGHKNELNHEETLNYTDYKENMGSEDDVYIENGMNNEIERGSDSRTSYYDNHLKRHEEEIHGGNDEQYENNVKEDIERSCDDGTCYYDDYNIGAELKTDGVNDKSDEQYQNNENEGIESIVRPQTHVDRGPLDDVVEQVRGQPELEEGEMASSAHLYKPAKPHSGIHALFKGQGDKNTIRATQASIMRRNMDAEADPCEDFYQYACGNWAALNPIPADKAGYDTFEMLRENLDSILKDLLEFTKDEQIESKYPGPHLDTNDNLLEGSNYLNENNNEQYQTTMKVQLHEVLKGAHEGKYRYYWKKPEQEKSEIINRIRHILNRKPRATLKQLKTHHAKLFHSKIRQPYQRHRRRLKQKRLVKKSLKYHPRRKFTLKRSNINPVTLFRRRKIQAINSNHKKRPKRETECKKPGTPSNNGDVALGDAAMKARFLFKSCMNYGILQKRGHQPLLDLLNLLGGWPILDPKWHKKDFDWLELMAKLRLYNNDILISEWVGPDIKNSDEFVIQFDQTSLGLPTREYFLQESNIVYLNAYKNYLIKVALLLGGDKDYVEKSAEKLINFEIKLAKITSAPEDRRNVSELYRRMTLQKLENMVPEVKWRRYLCVVMNRTVHPNETVVLFALNYVRHLVTLIDETDSSILSNYLLWRFVRHRVNNLDDRFQSAKQQFYFILFGREQAPPRWKNCISQVNSNMGMALGSMFVKKYFDETSKNDTLTMTREIQQSFRELLHEINWIDSETKSLAAHKVDAMMLRIGYPDFILSRNQLNERYKEVIIHPDKYFENILNILQHLTQMEQSRIGQPVNKTLWNTAPAVVNAYYSRNKNQIMFPAGILQPPFYHRHFPRSLNYGGIGVVIGHEITHGFDDKGRLFDCHGNLHRWWSDAAIESFHRRAQCLIDQYGQYVVPEVNMKLDGINTQGENIADNGGVKQAFRAYKHWIQKHGTEGETLPGLNHTHTQLFFLNFAQVWCGAMRPEAMRNKLKTAVHSPGRFRVIGTLSNSDDFAREFKCPPGTPMNPNDKCTVW